MRLAGSTLTAALLLGSGGCSAWLFSDWSGPRRPDASRPVVIVETRGGTELGASTTEGVLLLGRTAQTGPCRVHYFLGETPMVDDGQIRPAGGIFYRADVDLAQQWVHLLERDPRPDDDLVAMLPAGTDVATVPVRLARSAEVEGDVLEWPGRPLPAGTPIFTRDSERWLFVGLVAGEAHLEAPGAERRYLVMAGTDRLREMLATPRRYPQPERVKYRPDDVHVIRRSR